MGIQAGIPDDGKTTKFPSISVGPEFQDTFLHAQV
jgi:hypothetical protein